MTKRELLQTILRGLAVKALKKYKPKIIGITGSVGKTSTKEAVYTILNTRYDVVKSDKNYNNEVGIPLTILNLEAGNNVVGWGIVILKGLWLTIWRKRYYPEILILEVGIDRPGDMDYIKDFVHFDIGVVTKIGTSHIEFFKDKNDLAKEKLKLLKNCKNDDIAVLNADDEYIKKHFKNKKCSVMTYGFDQDATVSADPQTSHAKLSDTTDAEYSGITTKVNYDGKHIPVLLPNIISRHHIYAALAGIAVGLSMEMNLIEVTTALKKFRPLPGRMNVLKGLKDTWIIDDTYNAAPESTIAALQSLETLDGVKGRRIAVLGDMLELGQETMAAHQKIAELVNGIADIIVTVGERGRIIAERLERLGFPKENLFVFDRSYDDIDDRNPGTKLEEMIEEGDVILVKGSRGAHMERIVKEIMAEPEKEDELLVK